MTRTYSPKRARSSTAGTWWMPPASLSAACRPPSPSAHGQAQADLCPHDRHRRLRHRRQRRAARAHRRQVKSKIYWHTSGCPGGFKTETAEQSGASSPSELVEEAVWGMLPKNKLGRQQLSKLKVYAGPEHPHQAQQPQPRRRRGPVSGASRRDRSEPSPVLRHRAAQDGRGPRLPAARRRQAEDQRPRARQLLPATKC